MLKEKPATKICKHCKWKISYGENVMEMSTGGVTMLKGGVYGGQP